LLHTSHELQIHDGNCYLVARGTYIHFITKSIVLNLADKSTLQVQARFHSLYFTFLRSRFTPDNV